MQDGLHVDGAAKLAVGAGPAVSGRLVAHEGGLRFASADGTLRVALTPARLLDLVAVDRGRGGELVHHGERHRFTGDAAPDLATGVERVRDRLAEALETQDSALVQWPASWADTEPVPGTLILSQERFRFVPGVSTLGPPAATFAMVSGAGIDAEKNLTIVWGQRRATFALEDPAVVLRELGRRLLPAETALGPPASPNGELDGALAWDAFGRWLEPGARVALCCEAIQVDDRRVRRGWVGANGKEAFFVPAHVLVPTDVQRFPLVSLTSPQQAAPGRLTLGDVKIVLRAAADFVERFWRHHELQAANRAPSTPSGPNRRRTFRVPVRDEARVTVWIHSDTGTEEVSAKLLDVSLEGCGIELGAGDGYSIEAPKPIDKTARVEVEFQFGEAAFRAEGKVVFSAKQGRTGLWRHGIQLTSVPRDVERRIREMVMEIQRQVLARAAKTDV